MSKIVRYRFMGSWISFWLLCVTVIGLPIAALYLLTGTVRLDTDVDNPEELGPRSVRPQEGKSRHFLASRRHWPMCLS